MNSGPYRVMRAASRPQTTRHEAEFRGPLEDCISGGWGKRLRGGEWAEWAEGGWIWLKSYD